MPKLSLTTQLQKGEHATSFASRLAQINQVSLKAFARDMGLSLKRLSQGDDDAIRSISELGDVSYIELRQHTPRLNADRTFTFLGHGLSTGMFHGAAVLGCAKCLLQGREENIVNQTYLRGIWSMQAISLCATHGTDLQLLWRDPDPITRWDPVAHKQDLVSLVTEPLSDRRTVNKHSFSNWLSQALYQPRDRAGWLAQLDLGTVTALCGALGADLGQQDSENGLRVCQDDLSKGLEIASRGEDSIVAEVDRLLEEGQLSRAEFGLAMPRLHHLLKGQGISDQLKPLRTRLRTHLYAKLSLTPGQELFGEPILRHYEDANRSVLALSEKAGGRPEHTRNFVSAREFCTKFGISTAQLTQFKQSMPLNSGQSEAGFSLEAGQKLLDQIFYGAERCAKAQLGWCTVEQAAHRLNLGFGQIISAILDHKFPRIGRHPKRIGFDAIMLDMQFYHGDEQPVSAEVYAFSQGIDPSEMLSFCRQGLVSCQVADRAVGRKDKITMRSEDRKAFEARFISYRKLGLRLARSWDELDDLLQSNNIMPVTGYTGIYQLAEVVTAGLPSLPRAYQVDLAA